MTVQKFLIALKAKRKATGAIFEAHPEIQIQCRFGRFGTKTGWFCPIEWLAGVRAGEYIPAARKLGLSSVDAKRIVNAADKSNLPNFEPKLRQQLLAACGVKKQ